MLISPLKKKTTHINKQNLSDAGFFYFQLNLLVLYYYYKFCPVKVKIAFFY